jgi:hypothetical protein
MVDVKRVQIRAEGFQFNMQAVSESYMTGTLSFMRTEAWLARHVMYGNRPLLAQGDPAVYQALHLNATLDLVLERRRIAHDTVPELYRHDVHRLFKYQTEFYYITVTMGIISIAGPACQFDEDKMEVNLDFFFIFHEFTLKNPALPDGGPLPPAQGPPLHDP